MAITTTNTQWDLYAPIWRQVSDFLGGKILLERRAQTYLPKEPQWTDEQYTNYVKLAPYTNFTLRTKQTLLGALFQKTPTIELAAPLSYLNQSADDHGNGIESFVQRIASEVIAYGRYFVIADFPRSNFEREEATQENTEGLQAHLAGYSATSVDHWSIDKGFVKVRELVEKESDDMFNIDTVEQHRVFMLKDGVYTQQIWHDGALMSEFQPRDYNGNTLDYIPGVMFGSVNNDFDVDDSPLYEISEKSKTHYQLSADVMRSVRLVGTPMAHVDFGEMSFNQFAEANGLDQESPEFKFGSASGVLTAKGGKVDIIQAQPNTMAATERDKALEEAVFIGARIVQPNNVEMTASQAIIESGAEQSVLSTIKSNVEQGVNQLLEYLSAFMSPVQVESQFEMSDSFFQMSPDAQMLTVAMSIYDRGRMADQDFHNLLKRTGLIAHDRSLDDIKEEVGDLSPLV